MTLESVEARVREDIESQIAKLQGEGAARVADIDAQTRKAVAALMQRALSETDAILERMQTREKLSTQLIVKKILLNARREAIHDTFMAAAKELREDPERYPRILREQVREAKKSIDISSVRCDSAEGALLETILDEEGISAGIIPDLRTGGGFVAESEGARVRFDASLKTIFEELAHECLKDVANILWPAPATAPQDPQADSGAADEEAAAQPAPTPVEEQEAQP